MTEHDIYEAIKNKKPLVLKRNFGFSWVILPRLIYTGPGNRLVLLFQIICTDRWLNPDEIASDDGWMPQVLNANDLSSVTKSAERDCAHLWEKVARLKNLPVPQNMRPSNETVLCES
jgi:hypothetical protein